MLKDYIARANAAGQSEGAQRGELVLKYLPYGLTDATADALIPQINRYQQATTPVQRRQALTRLIRTPGGSSAIVVLITEDENTERKEESFYQSQRYDADRIAQKLIGEGRTEMAARWLAFASTVGDAAADQNNQSSNCMLAQNDYAVLLRITGRLDAKITETAASLQKPTDAMHDAVKHRLLAYLYQMKGDLPAAIAQARLAGEQGATLLVELSWHAGDWTGAAEAEAAIRAESHSPAALGELLTFEHLAGQENSFKATAARYLSLLVETPNQRSPGIPFILCSRPDLAREAYRTEKMPIGEFETLCAQYRYTEAFKIFDAAEAEGGLAALEMERTAARELERLGLSARAHALRDKCAAGASALAALDADNAEDACRLLAGLASDELESGRTEQAFRLMLQGLEISSLNRSQSTLIYAAFPHDFLAEPAWNLLRSLFPEDSNSRRLTRLRELREGSTSTDELRELVMQQQPDNLIFFIRNAGLIQMLYQRLTDERGGAEPTTEQRMELDKLLSIMPTPLDGTDAVKRAEMLADPANANSLIAELSKQWARDQGQAAPLYLEGLALRRAGREQEAKKAIDLANLIPLGRIAERQELIDLLERHQAPEAAATQREWLLRINRGSIWTDQAQRVAGVAAARRGEGRAGAELFEQSLPALAQCDYFLPNLRYYFTIAAERHQFQGEALLAEGNVDEAMNELRMCQTAWPTSPMPMVVAAKLESLGHRAEVDELVNADAAAQEAGLEQFPDSPLIHNDYAWLLAKTHRRLDDALSHAEKAVAIAPGTFAYLDTLAEVHFHRGDRKKAIELMTHAADAARRSRRAESIELAAKRLKHFEQDAIPTGPDL